MVHAGKKEHILLHPNKSRKKNDHRLKSIYSDRRSGKDRRKSHSAAYFSHGGLERRSWRERRYLWYMTD
jgi:hypothetical protein